VYGNDLAEALYQGRIDLNAEVAPESVHARGGRAVRKPDADEMLAQLEHDELNPKETIHLPNPSYFPLTMAMGLPLVFYGIIYHTTAWGKGLIVIGALISLASLIGWGIEPLEEPHPAHEDVSETSEEVDVDD
jgi:membrane-bound ClpP family serine protease